MIFGWFKKKDPVCGMKQEKGTGIEKNGQWFCSTNCVKKYEQKDQQNDQKCCSPGKCGCEH